MKEPVVFVVDDDRAVREALRLLIESAGLPARTYASGREFLAEYEPGQPGCLVLDVRMRDLSGLDLQERLAHDSITIPIIFVTGHGDVSMSVRAMKSGAVDFLEKPFNDQVLLDAIWRGIERDRVARAGAARRSDIADHLALLTRRERQVLELIVAGKPNKLVAAELGIAEKTVKIHRRRVMEKMGVGSFAELVQLTAGRA